MFRQPNRLDSNRYYGNRHSGMIADAGSRVQASLGLRSDWRISTKRSPLSLKNLAVMALSPLTLSSKHFSESFRRVWAHARLGRDTNFPVPLSVVILGAAEIQGTGCVRFGENLLLYRELYFETQNAGSITIDDEVVISRGAHIVSFDRIEIGRGTMIGEYSSIRDANHRVGGAELVRYAGHKAASIKIGRNVWIGRSVAVLPGVTIGDNAVIGANAVVTHDIPASAIAVGIPARPRAQTGPGPAE